MNVQLETEAKGIEQTATGLNVSASVKGRILGAHLLGPHAEEVVNLFALAIQFGLTAKDLSSLKYAYPTHASDILYMIGQ